MLQTKCGRGALSGGAALTKTCNWKGTNRACAAIRKLALSFTGHLPRCPQTPRSTRLGQWQRSCSNLTSSLQVNVMKQDDLSGGRTPSCSSFKLSSVVLSASKQVSHARKSRY